jgi:putative sigma-54 modulation protein
MKIHVLSKQVEMDETVRAHIDRRLQFGLARLSPRILRVTVQIIDLNGPRGGEDKCCRIEVRLRPTGSIFVEDTASDLYAAVDGAADRALRSVIRSINRTRDLDRDSVLPSIPLPASMSSDMDELPTVWEVAHPQRKTRRSQ